MEQTNQQTKPEVQLTIEECKTIARHWMELRTLVDMGPETDPEVILMERTFYLGSALGMKGANIWELKTSSFPPIVGICMMCLRPISSELIRLYPSEAEGQQPPRGWDKIEGDIDPSKVVPG